MKSSRDPLSHSLFQTRDPHVLYWRTNADLATINENKYIADINSNLTRILSDSNLATHVNDVDDMFFDAAQKWSEALMSFLKDSEMDESFFK